MKATKHLVWVVLWMVTLLSMGWKYGEAPSGFWQWSCFFWMAYDFICYAVIDWKERNA